MRLRDLRQWVCWRYEERYGEITKVPYSPATGARARSNAPRTWGTFAEARQAESENDYGGIGFVFTADDPFCGVDLDGCVAPETGEIESWAVEILTELDSYTEFSPSGTGSHVIVRAELPEGGNRKNRVEMYDRKRFFTVTGRRLPGTSHVIEQRQERIDALHGRLFPPRERHTPAEHTFAGNDLSDEQVLERCRRARNAQKFEGLYDVGGSEEYGDDHSRADQALVSIMAFFTQDPEQLDRLFRRSALCREKWTGRADYRRRTIDKALHNLTETYDGPADGARLSRNGNREKAAAPKEIERTGPEQREPAAIERRENRGPLRLPEDLAFPVDALPEECRTFVAEGALAMGCPPDFLAMPALATLSSAIGASRVVQIKRSWREGAALFLSVVAPPGAKKTPAAKAATEPVRKRQAQLAREYRKKMDAYEREMREWEVDKKLAYKDNQPAPRQPEHPTMERVVADDTTVEALVGILENNPRGLLIDKDELTGWVRAMDQYKGGKGADRQHWLSIWSSKAVVVDRKSRAGEPVIIERPWVSLFGGIQPGMLKELGGGQEDGLLDRFLFAYPKPRRTLFSEAEISHEAEIEYANLYQRLLSLEMVEDEFGDPNPGVVPMDEAARNRFRQAVDAMATEVFEPGFPARLAGVWSKMEGYLARISLVLALCRCVSTEEMERVGVVDVEAASKLLEYFKAHARRVYAELKAATAEDLLVDELRKLLVEHDGSWAGSATELYELLEKREAEGLPDNPDWLTRTILAIADRTESLNARKGWGKVGDKRGRILRLNLKNGVDGVVGVAAEQDTGYTTNTNNTISEETSREVEAAGED